MTIFQIQIPKAVPTKAGPTPSQSVTPDGAPNVANSGEQTAKVDDELQAARKLDGEEKTASTEEDKTKQEREARLINEQRFEKYTEAAEERLEEKLRPIRKTLNVVQQNIGAVCQATPGARCAVPGAVDRGD